jgi:hypothetical protein
MYAKQAAAALVSHTAQSANGGTFTSTSSKLQYFILGTYLTTSTLSGAIKKIKNNGTINVFHASTCCLLGTLS